MDVIVRGPTLHDRIIILFIKMFKNNPLFTVGVLSITTSTAQQITSTSGIKDRRFACVDSTVILTCEVRGSEGIAWRSDAYIGSENVQLGYSAQFKDVGDILSASNGQTVANPSKKYVENGALVLESTLRVIVSDSQSSSVTCTNGTDLGITTFTFIVLCEFCL